MGVRRGRLFTIQGPGQGFRVPCRVWMVQRQSYLLESYRRILALGRE